MPFIPYTKKDIKGNRFYRIPKEFVENEVYRTGLNSNAKFLYAVLRDRYELSIKNNWIDKNGYVYCYYSREKLAFDLALGKRTVDGAIKNLEELELLKEEHVNGKAKKYYIGLATLADSATVEDKPSQILHPIDTESFSLSDTEYLKDIYIISEENDVFSYYSIKFKEMFGKVHPTMNAEKMDELRSNFDHLNTYLDIDKEQWIEAVDYHFDQLSPNNNGNILSFLSLNGGHGCVYRYLEDLAAEYDEY